MKENQSGRAYVDSGFFTRSGDWAIAPVVGVGVQPVPNLELELAVPVGITTGTGGASRIGNPYVGASYIKDGPDFRLKVGGGLALPAFSIDSFSDVGPALAGLATRAYQESWLWYADSVPIVAPVHFEAPLGTPVSFVGDAAAFFAIAIGDRRESDFGVQLAPGFAAHAGDAVSLGARLTVFKLLIAQGSGDTSQLAIEPFVRYAADPVFASLRFTMPLDEPLGFAFDTNRFWGLHLGLGVGF